MLNKAILVGRLTADPELKATSGGISVTKFNIAIDRSYSSKDGKRDTDFITIVAWRNTAEFICKYFSKGSAIGIDGSIQTRSYTDKNDNNRTAFEVIAEKASFVERKNTNASTHNADTKTPDNDDFSIIDDVDDLPF